MTGDKRKNTPKTTCHSETSDRCHWSWESASTLHNIKRCCCHKENGLPRRFAPRNDRGGRSALSFPPCSSRYSGDPFPPVCALGTSPRRGSASRQRFWSLRRFGQRFAAKILHWRIELHRALGAPSRGAVGVSRLRGRRLIDSAIREKKRQHYDRETPPYTFTSAGSSSTSAAETSNAVRSSAPSSLTFM